jgi:hypothetical protein
MITMSSKKKDKAVQSSRTWCVVCRHAIHDYLLERANIVVLNLQILRTL